MTNLKRKQLSVAILATLSATATLQLAHAGVGWGDSQGVDGTPLKVPTFFANSPSGPLDSANCFTAPSSTGAFAGALTVEQPVAGNNCDTGTALRKFVDPMGAIPVAVADKTAYPGSDYYEIAVVDYTQKMHSDLANPTRLRGYVQISATGTVPLHYLNADNTEGAPILLPNGQPAMAVAKPTYLGPIISSTRGTPTRIKFYNLLASGAAGNLHMPVDETITGAGKGPTGDKYQQNRMEIHLHGGDNPWISDGTPHQWILPAADEIALKAAGKPEMARGVGAKNVPDMPDPGPGAMTYYFPNGQSGRLMFYHDHTVGLTRLNVYAGVAAGYVLNDLPGQGENHPDLQAVLPAAADTIPLVIQDKTFVPKNIAVQDSKWNGLGLEGDLWYPHVYETNQDPYSFDGTNATGRWDWGPWFWPVFPSAYDLPTGEIGAVNGVTGLSEVSTTPEAFMDTPLVNGTAYPTMTVEPKTYRFRVLNAANDRFMNLGLYLAVDKKGVNIAAADPSAMYAGATPCSSVLAVPVADCTEVKMVNFDNSYVPPAAPYTPDGTLSFPTAGGPMGSGWGTPVGTLAPQGAPDPATAGPHIVQIGNEGGLLAQPHDIPSTPLNYEYNKRSFTVLNVLERGLYLSPAERADVLVDFSKYAGKTLILYNDAPAPVPASDPRVDYYTGHEDFTGSGGAAPTKPGYGPNTRTIMQIHVADAAPAAPLDTGKLAAALPIAFASTQDKPVVPEPEFQPAFAADPVLGNATTRTNGRIYTGSIFLGKYQGLKFTTPEAIDFFPTPVCKDVVTCNAAVSAQIANPALTGGGTSVSTIGNGLVHAPAGASIDAYVQNKAIQELFDPGYGRMNATLGVELPFTSALTQTTLPLAYIDPTTETVADGETQFWKITHNGVDTHPVHFHLVNVQVVNRVGWDGTIKPPLGDEFGWKETVKMNPLEDVIVAVRAKKPTLQGVTGKNGFGLPLSSRLRDPSQLAGEKLGFTQINPADGTPAVVTNTVDNYGWEYVWHCHILGHEENDFMRPVKFDVKEIKPAAPSNLTVTSDAVDQASLQWSDDSNTEYAFTIQRREIDGATAQPKGEFAELASISPALANASSALDTAATGLDNSNLNNTVAYEYKVCAIGAADPLNPNCTTAKVGKVLTPPLAATDFAATPASDTSVTLSWTDVATTESGYLIERSTDGNNWTTITPTTVAGLTVSVAANTVSAVDSGLTQNTSYQYRITARNTAGDSAQVGPVSVTTLYAAAPAITGLTASPVSDTSITVSWTAVTAGTATEISLVRSSAGVADVSIPVALGDSTVTDTGLTQGTAYTYTINTLNGVNNAQPNAGPVATIAATTHYAAAPALSAVTATADSPTQVSLAWTAVSPVTGYQVERTVNGVTTALGTLAKDAISYVDSTAVQHTDYTYTVTPVNGVKVDNTANLGTAATATVTTPYANAGAVSNLVAISALTVNPAPALPTPRVDLTWSGVAPATADVVTRCEHSVDNLNCTAATSVFAQVASLPAPASSFTDTSVAMNTTYTYTLQAFNGTGALAGQASNVLTTTVTTPASPVVVAAPTSLRSTISLGRIRLTWLDTPVGTEVAPTSFLIYRSIDGVNFGQVGTVSGATRRFDDTALVPGYTYTYKVVGQNVTGGVLSSSLPSNIVNAVYALPAVPSAPVQGATTATSVTLSWAAVPNTTRYNLYRDGFLVWSGTTTSTRVTTGMTAGSSYTFTLTAANALGASQSSAPLNATLVTVAPAAPTALAGAVGSKTAILTLPALPAGGVSYTIRYRLNGGAWIDLVSGVTNSPYTATLPSFGSYQFRLVSVNAGGNSAASASSATVRLQ